MDALKVSMLTDDYREGYLQALKDADAAAEPYDRRAYECCGMTARNIRLELQDLMAWIEGRKPTGESE